MEKIKRKFKGVWIPASIWLNESLSTQEKVFLAEIDSLDNDKGCFASNAHFAKFSKLTKARCTQIIKELERKEFITVTLKKKNNQITKRIIKVNYLNQGGGKYSKQGGGKNPKQGGKNPKRIIIQYNNTVKKKEEDKSSSNSSFVHSKEMNTNYPTPKDFNLFWKEYPKKQNKAKSLQAWEKMCKLTKTSKVDKLKNRPKLKQILKAVKKHKKSERWIKQPQYIPIASTWLNQFRWNTPTSELTYLEDFNNKPKNSIGYRRKDGHQYKETPDMTM